MVDFPKGLSVIVLSPFARDKAPRVQPGKPIDKYGPSINNETLN